MPRRHASFAIPGCLLGQIHEACLARFIIEDEGLGAKGGGVLLYIYLGAHPPTVKLRYPLVRRIDIRGNNYPANSYGEARRWEFH